MTFYMMLTGSFVTEACHAPFSLGQMGWRKPGVKAPASAAHPAQEDTDAAKCHLERFQGQAMGTNISFVAWTSDALQAQDAFRAGLAEIGRIEQLMTTWMHPGWGPSDIMRLNAAAGDHAVTLSPDTLAVLNSAVCMGKASDGLFDVTIGALDAIWHFDEDLIAEIPDAAAIMARLPSVDYRNVALDQQRSTGFLKRRGMAINLGGIAKGYAVDRAIDVMHAAGIDHVVVQAGGDLYASGQRGQKPWRIGIRDPRGRLADDVVARVAVHDQAVSTAGDYERGFDVQGRRYHHILDPRTGRPSIRCRSVTVLAPSAWLADAIDDVVFILGPQEGLTWLKRFDHVEAIVVDNHGEMFVSDGLRDALVYRNAQDMPTTAPLPGGPWPDGRPGASGAVDMP